MSKADVSNNGTPSASSVLAELVDQLTARLHAGESIDWEAEARAHPEHAAELRRLVPALGALDQLSRSADAALPTVGRGPGDDAALVAGVLGDFRIIREVGRGGMGIVYEAEQISLGRRVALKVLPFAATLDPRQLQRFHNEARAAAGLHHTHIVPVHGVGNERGVHYYAMQFIEGRTLADFIAERRGGPPSQVPTRPEADVAPATTSPLAAQATSAAPRDAAYFRRVTEWGIQAAEALDSAHAVGVVHRDVKPANLLVDGSGRLWVTDFGLAQVQSDARLTMTGDLVGTLRYMSPEQALAKRVVIDHRTDIYSLGATLYEVLTLQPAFDGADRQELLRQIAFEEPKALRRLNRAIPAELETIVLKALEKNPAERYATAQELADDLERWSRDEPIRARRPSLVQRARKWCRRHRPVAIGLAASLAAAVVLAVVMGFWYQRRLAETEGGVSAALAEAQLLVREGDKQTEHPERWQHTAQLALAAQVRAEKLLAAGVATEALVAQVRQGRAAVDAAVADSRLLVELDRIRLEHAAAVRNTHSDDQQTAPLYAALLVGYGVDPAAPEAAAARVRDSRLRESLLAALADWEEVSPDEAERQRLAKVYQLALPSDSLLARWLAAVKRGDDAEVGKLVAEASLQNLPPATVVMLEEGLFGRGEKYRAACEQLLRAGLERHPGDFWLNHYLGGLLKNEQPRRPEEAVRYLTAALAVRPDSSGAHLNLGNALKKCGDMEGAMRRYRAALEIDPMYVAAHMNLGHSLYAKGRLDEAIKEYRTAISLRNDDAASYYDLGFALQAQGLQDKAVVEYEEAVRLQPDFPEAHMQLGNALHDKGLLDQAIAKFREALATKRPFHEAYIAHNSLGIALAEKGLLDEGIRQYRAALLLKKDYPLAQGNLGVALWAKGQFDDAIAAYTKALELEPKNPAWPNNLAWALATHPNAKVRNARRAVALAQQAIQAAPNCGGFWSTLGIARYRAGDPKAAIEALTKSMELSKVDDASNRFFRAMACYQLGRRTEARQHYDKAVAWLEQTEQALKNNKCVTFAVEQNPNPTNEQRHFWAEAEELRRFRDEAEEVLELKKK
jgi:serine/threonine protein kinase/Flp pilus assembly protein TadD